jgi:hypothetical protein
MSLCIPSRTDLKRLFIGGWWSLRLIYSTSRGLTTGLAVAAVARGVVPAGLALFARGLINKFVTDRGISAITVEEVIPWVLFGFAVTLLEAIAPLATKFCTERLRDEVIRDFKAFGKA